VIVCFVDFGGIVDHHCLNFLFITVPLLSIKLDNFSFSFHPYTFILKAWNQIFKVNVKLDHILLNDTIWVSQTYSTVAILIDGLVYGVSCHFQQYFSYIVVVSFSGGENRQPVASD
jgi:hypothetical protein